MNDDLGEHELGGKAAGLIKLQNCGVAVPPFFVVPASVFRATLATTSLPNLIGTFLFEVRDTRKDDWAGLCTEWSPRLLAAINASDTSSLEEFVRPRLANMSTTVAVRSSMVGEDSLTASFAGQLHTSLGVSPDLAAATEAIVQCWASIFEGHALWYALHHGVDLLDLRVGVVIQQQVPAVASGVVFTADPQSGDRSTTVISVARGYGEGVVGGLVDADEYRWSRGRETSATISNESQQVHYVGTDPTLTPVPPELVGTRVLPTEVCAQVHDLARLLADSFGMPLDIEIAYDGGAVWFVQARPITALPQPQSATTSGETWLWDDANIQESFCGVTLPLTFSFASRAYQMVYRSLAQVMGVVDLVDQEHSDMVRTMIGLLDGRVFYNLNAWFEGLSLLPSVGHNKTDMERMMGVEEPVPFVVDQMVSTTERARSILNTVPVAVRLAPKYLRLNTLIEEFDQQLADVLDSVDRADVANWSIAQCLHTESRLWTEVFPRWQVPIINDIKVMQTSGSLHRLIDSLTPDQARRDRLAVELLSAIDGLASVEPTRRLLELASFLQQHHELATMWCTGQPLVALAAVRAADRTVDNMVSRYVDEFGGRCIGELKLETISVRQDPTFLVQVVRGYLSQPDLDPRRLVDGERIRFESAREELVVLAGPRRRRKALAIVAGARRAIAAREHLRLARTNVFDLARILYTTIGVRLYEAQVLDDPRDVMYLTIDEVRGFHEGTTVTTHLKQLVALRRQEFDGYATMSPDHRIETIGTVHLSGAFQRAVADIEESAQTWTGLGCYPGIVTAPAAVIVDPSNAANVTGRIIVAVRTDPGWAPLFPCAVGLVVERGSSLSHSAVIARELGLPTVVGANGVSTQIPDEAQIRIDGQLGLVQLCSTEEPIDLTGTHNDAVDTTEVQL